MSAKVVPSVSRVLQEYIILPNLVPAGIGINDIDLSTSLTRYSKGDTPEIRLNIPVISAAMQSVTGVEMMKAMAAEGGLGITYQSQLPEEEAAMVREVKEYKAGFVEPDVFSPEATIAEVDKSSKERGYSTFPVTGNGKSNGKLLGWITGDDYIMPKHADKTVAERMLSVDRMKYAKLADVIEDGAPNLNKAWDILGESHQNSLPIVNDSEELVYVVFKKDAESRVEHPRELMDKKRRLMCGAAVNTHDYKTRSKLLADAEVDLFVVDASQGMSDYMVETVRYLKENYDQPVIAGNIVTKEGFRMLAKAGADTVKVGMGSGYICSTQDQKRVGRGQATAVMEVVAAANELYKKDGVRIPIISDGGVLNFGDMTVALALGPSAVMVGRLVAGCRESPTDIITINDNEQVKPVWGEASLKAQAWQKERYEQNIFEEGFETVVPYVGQLKPYMQKGLARVRAGVRDAGCRNIRELHTNRNVTLEPMSSIMREEIEVKRGRAINVKLALLAAETGSKTK